MGVIKNAEVLGTSELRKDALAIAEAGYASVDVRRAFTSRVSVVGEELHIDDTKVPIQGRRIFYVGVGKCAIAGAAAVEKILGERLAGGIALDVRGVGDGRLEKIQIFVGTHPKPSEQNLEAAARIAELLELCGDDDLVIMVISGGGSTLLCLHDPPMTCVDEGVIFDALTEKGATIQEMNTVRKHISKARGGWLAKIAAPTEVVALIISDVPGNDPQFVASGPTVCDDSTVEDARAVLARYGLPEPFGGLIETPKDNTCFANVTNLLFLTNETALEAMKAEAAERGYNPAIITDRLTGEAADCGRAIARRLREAPPKSALLYGGETTVTLTPGHPAGGRCQELALGALAELGAGQLVCAFSSDGRDATEHAGAIADDETLAHARERGLSVEDALTRHASFDFFKTSGDALITGLLESNVSDLTLALTN